MAFDQFDVLDPFKELRDINAALGTELLDQFDLLDPARAWRKVNSLKPVVDIYSLLDPQRLLDRLIVALVTQETGMTPISSGKITTPVEYFDVALPSGYYGYLFLGLGIVVSDEDLLAAAFSPDDGSTFHNDTTNFDTYIQTEVVSEMLANGTRLPPANGGTVDSLFYPFFASGGGEPFNTAMFIYPGESGTRAQVFGLQHMQRTNTPDATPFLTSFLCLTGAVLATAMGRQNLMRVLPYGNGDAAPPTSGETLSAGSWTLLGLPNPT